MRIPKPTSWQLLAGLAFTLAVPGAADTRVPDPGFSFVDVNNDGLYSASDGDIGAGSRRPVDIDALIAIDGTFDTGRSKGNYRAPYRPTGLVLSQAKPVATTFNLQLHAGRNLRVYATMSAPSASLSACGSVNVSNPDQGVTTLNSGMSVQAGGDAILDGASIYALDLGSAIDVQACGNVSMVGASLLAYDSISATAACRLTMDGAALLTFDATSEVNAFARDIVAGNFFTVFCPGDIEIMTDRGGYRGGCGSHSGGGNQYGNGGQSGCTSASAKSLFAGSGSRGGQCGSGGHSGHNGCNWSGGSIQMPQAVLQGGQAEIGAGASVDLRDSSILLDGGLDIEAGGTVSANSVLTSWTAGAIDLDANAGFDVSSATLTANTAAVTLTSNCGWAKLDAATLSTPDSVVVYAKGDISATMGSSPYGFTARADNLVKLVSSCGTLTAPNSVIRTYTGSNPATTISACARGTIDISDAQWESPASISVQSTCGNLVAQRASLLAANPVAFFAGGLTIDLRSAVFGPAEFTYGPTAATVLQ